MRLVVLGGTAQLGREVACQAVAAGWEVTCMARGVSGPPAEGVRLVRADRDDPDAMSALDGERFDAMVDVSSRPSHVRRSTVALAGRVGHVTYVSTGSVYADRRTPGQRAGQAPVLAPAPPDIDDPAADGYAAYGPCKVACEQAVLAAFEDSAFVCRAGLIVGSEDDSGRFEYWVRRLAAGGEVLAPGAPDDPVQFVDVRDLAGWIVRAAQQGLTGVFDGIGEPVPRARFLAGVAAGAGTDPAFTWVPQQFLTEHGIRPWSGPDSLPMWLPLPEYAGFMSRDATASLAAGLVCRPVSQTAHDTKSWLDSQPPVSGVRADANAPVSAAADEPRAGIEREREAALLHAWHSRPA